MTTPKRKPWTKPAGYDHSRLGGRPWQKLRERMLREHPLCQLCEQRGRVTVATSLDHRIPRSKEGGTDDESNLQTVCEPCHARKSLLDRGFRVRPRIGADGYPIIDDE